MPGRYRLVIRPASEEVDQRAAGVDERGHRLLVRGRRVLRHPLPFVLAERGKLVREAASIHRLERNRVRERSVHLLGLLARHATFRLDRVAGALDGYAIESEGRMTSEQAKEMY